MDQSPCTELDGFPQDATFILPVGLELELPGSWTCGVGTMTWQGVNAGPILSALGVNGGNAWTMDLTLTLDTASNTLEMDLSSAQLSAAMALARLDSASCMLEPIPFEMSLLTPGVCE